ncbi:MAG TPA: DUF5695 domain-containing protein, partial [Chthonomonadales bacterium]|nr:DUF5695 domain-containing protein [Chthonomonadales bacterium]
GYSAYIHSAAARRALRAKGGTWRLPSTSADLAPAGRPGSSAQYGFEFHWARDYHEVRQRLYQFGLADPVIAPGLTVPTNLPASICLRTLNGPPVLLAEHREATIISRIAGKGKNRYFFDIRFQHLGENLITARFRDRRELTLEFFVTQPLDTLIKKRAAFLVSHAQHRDPSKWYNGLFSEWDMKDQVLRSPDDLDGLPAYAVACDDPALGKAPYVAAKNVYYPVPREIAAVEYYIRHYVWGGLQQTDREPYPYGIYGIPNWHVLRNSPFNDKRGKAHLWRIYDYPHVILLYYRMYQVANRCPGLVHYLTKQGYLERAFGTAKAYFTLPLEIAQWSPYESGTYDEVIIPHLIRALYANGMAADADWLRAAWQRKCAYFINRKPYLFGSEYSFDTTGFESTEALARYACHHMAPRTGEGKAIAGACGSGSAVSRADAESFLRRQMRLNIACRGSIEPAYYWMGSDYRASGNASYTLSYMSQMGGWAVLDYGLNFARDPALYLRLGYASVLSSWALLNCGDASSNYGYWYPGKSNDGAASGGFEPRPWGVAWLGRKVMGRGPWWYSGEIDLGFGAALRAAATVVTDDPVFGLYAYGGAVTAVGGSLAVFPRDGLRCRLDILLSGRRVEMELRRDGFAAEKPVLFNRNLTRFTFQVENRSGGTHTSALRISGLPAGDYRVQLNGKRAAGFQARTGRTVAVEIPVTGAIASGSIRWVRGRV